MNGPDWLKIGYDVKTSRILTTILKKGKIVVQTPSTSPFHPKYYFEGHPNGQEYVKSKSLYYIYTIYTGGVGYF